MSVNNNEFNKLITATGTIRFGKGYFKGVIENGVMKKGTLKINDNLWFEGERICRTIENPNAVYNEYAYEPDLMTVYFLKGTIYLSEKEYYTGYFYEDSFFDYTIKSWGEACYVNDYIWQRKKENKEINIDLKE